MTAELGPQRTWMTADEFWKSGLLYYVNSTVLWPLGLALAVEVDPHSGTTDERLRIMRLEPSETMVDGLPNSPDHPRDRAVDFITRRIAMMTEDEQQRAREVLLDPRNVAAFLRDDPGAQVLARPDLPDGA